MDMKVLNGTYRVLHKYYFLFSFIMKEYEKKEPKT